MMQKTKEQLIKRIEKRIERLDEYQLRIVLGFVERLFRP
jgi:hypothetical protein